MIIKTAY